MLSIRSSAFDLEADGGQLKPRLYGVKRASTFLGFCQAHDDGIFAELEKQEFAASRVQCLLLSVRAVAWEIHAKSGLLRMVPFFRRFDAGMQLEDQIAFQRLVDSIEFSVQLGLRDGERYLGRLKEMLALRCDCDFRGYVVEFPEPLPVMCAGAFAPEYGSSGARLQDLGVEGLSPSFVAVTAFASHGRGFLVLSWAPEHAEVCEAYCSSIDDATDGVLWPLIVALLFEHSDNVHISPSWWGGLDDTAKRALIGRLSDSANPLVYDRQQSWARRLPSLPGFEPSRRWWIGARRTT